MWQIRQSLSIHVIASIQTAVMSVRVWTSVDAITSNFTIRVMCHCKYTVTIYVWGAPGTPAEMVYIYIGTCSGTTNSWLHIASFRHVIYIVFIAKSKPHVKLVYTYSFDAYWQLSSCRNAISPPFIIWIEGVYHMDPSDPADLTSPGRWEVVNPEGARTVCVRFKAQQDNGRNVGIVMDNMMLMGTWQGLHKKLVPMVPLGTMPSEIQSIVLLSYLLLFPSWVLTRSDISTTSLKVKHCWWVL